MTVRSKPIAFPPLDAPGRQSGRMAAHAQRRAWIYLWLAFGICCTLLLSGVWVASTWRKMAYTSPPAQLVSKRGIVLYRGPQDALSVSISENSLLEEGGLIEVPASSEATLQIGVDGTQVRLRSSSTLQLTAMRVGRFNRALTRVALNQLDGAATYSVAGDLPDGREVEIKTPQTPLAADAIKLTKGEYLVWVQPDTTRLTSYLGQAKAEVSSTSYRLRDARWMALGADRSDLRQPLDLPEHLVKNRDFSKGLGEMWSSIDSGEKGRPDVGGKRDIVEAIVGGQTLRTLKITRDTAKDTHNETGLRQDINRDVSAYRSVTFAAWVKINSASLDGGGYAGSEYPLMFRINYVAENGGTYTWARGFYYRNETNRPVEIGEQIPPAEWYRFTLDMTKLKDRPAYIGSVEVLASGHDFDAQAADVELLVE